MKSRCMVHMWHIKRRCWLGRLFGKLFGWPPQVKGVTLWIGRQ